MRQSTEDQGQDGTRGIMKRSLALALATFLALGLLSAGLSAARDALHGVTTWSGSYSGRGDSF